MKNGSFQTVLGAGPTFNPSVMYLALLFTDLAVTQFYYPYIELSKVTAGISSTIKIYGLRYSTNYGLVILNKDLNSSHSGEVKITIKDQTGINCIYFTAASLDATTANIGGISYISNQSALIGNFNVYKYLPVNGYYLIPLNYSQAAYCYTFKSDISWRFFPTGSPLYEHYMLPLSFLIFLVFSINMY